MPWPPAWIVIADTLCRALRLAARNSVFRQRRLGAANCLASCAYW